MISHGVKVVGVHGEEGKEKDEEVRVEVKGEVEELREKRSFMDGMGDDGDGLKDDLSQCGVTRGRSTNTKQCADVLTHQCRACCTLCSCACWCTSCHCCHCPTLVMKRFLSSYNFYVAIFV